MPRKSDNVYCTKSPGVYAKLDPGYKVESLCSWKISRHAAVVINLGILLNLIECQCDRRPATSMTFPDLTDAAGTP